VNILSRGQLSPLGVRGEIKNGPDPNPFFVKITSILEPKNGTKIEATSVTKKICPKVNNAQ
jgi:hypothetical protein